MVLFGGGRGGGTLSPARRPVVAVDGARQDGRWWRLMVPGGHLRLLTTHSRLASVQNNLHNTGVDSPTLYTDMAKGQADESLCM